ncbi:hypothetical protein BSR29_00750 [Boudabousia liubingyangii]|uniref:FAD-binding FR-type domain-containing protein n=1 Tax=Boudabousia liubingyangii TaxID=1921764 RepID=A0A1Q5PPI9_9ACTO|nr:SIP domain-containing protein [Boudabousia liubingyangii]OKL49518.1 hypothetical protein BSR29_00750 [Boudabousia liubingyangii]
MSELDLNWGPEQTARVQRVQRLSRIFQRVWLQLPAELTPTQSSAGQVSPEQQPAVQKLQAGWPVQLQLPQTGESLAERTYTIAQVQESANGPRIALDIVVHDQMARYGVTGLSSTLVETEPSANPMADMMYAPATSDHPEIGLTSLPPKVTAAEDVTAGPGAAWAARTSTGNQIKLKLASGNHTLTQLYQYPNPAIAIVDPAAIPAAIALKAPVLIGKIPHKADRRQVPDTHTDWIRPHQDTESRLKEILAEIESEPSLSTLGKEKRYWVAGSQNFVQEIRTLLTEKLGEKETALATITFWTEN